ncbi:hypothetical protein ACQY1Q_15210 [Tenacibaculum sp. TC6]|uniref:hypothetical protein n=1 Tax=Tenacibaculum sp. TC6 TaxID=3423223 RepID=UPI003D36EE88
MLLTTGESPVDLSVTITDPQILCDLQLIRATLELELLTYGSLPDIKRAYLEELKNVIGDTDPCTTVVLFGKTTSVKNNRTEGTDCSAMDEVPILTPGELTGVAGLLLTPTEAAFLDKPENLTFKNQLDAFLIENNNSEEAKNFVLKLIKAKEENSLVSTFPFFKFPPNSNYEKLYPKFTEYLKNKLPEVKNISLITNTIRKITGLSLERIKKDLTWGQGPTIKIVQLDDFGSNTDYKTVGLFKKSTPDVIYLDIDFVNDVEQNISDQALEDSYLFFLGVTTLHEYVHLGDNVDGKQYTEALEEGNLFEMLVYGEDVNPNSLLFNLKKK